MASLLLRRCFVPRSLSRQLSHFRRATMTATETMTEEDMGKGQEAKSPVNRLTTFHQVVPLFYSRMSEDIHPPSKSQRIVSEIRSFPGFKIDFGPLSTKDELLLAHEESYIDNFLAGKIPQDVQESIAVPWSEQLVKEILTRVGCTIRALDALLDEGFQISGSLHGGFHHAFFSKSVSKHVFNDIAIAAALAIKKYSLRKILVLDLDAERGDGTASIFQKNPQVVTFSIHSSEDRESHPGVGDFDMECEPKMTDIQYGYMIRKTIPRVIEEVKPELIIFQAGVGMLACDKRKLMNLSRKAIRDRNTTVFTEALKQKIPVLIVRGSGHESEDEFQQQEIIEAHADVYRNALQTIVQFNHRLFYF